MEVAAFTVARSRQDCGGCSVSPSLICSRDAEHALREAGKHASSPAKLPAFPWGTQPLSPAGASPHVLFQLSRWRGRARLGASCAPRAKSPLHPCEGGACCGMPRPSLLGTVGIHHVSTGLLTIAEPKTGGEGHTAAPGTFPGTKTLSGRSVLFTAIFIRRKGWWWRGGRDAMVKQRGQRTQQAGNGVGCFGPDRFLLEISGCIL